MNLLQTADAAFADLNPAWFPGLAVVFDGRNTVRSEDWPASVRVLGVGVPDRPGSRG